MKGLPSARSAYTFPLFNQALHSAIVWSVVSAQILSINYSVEIKHPDLPVLNMSGNNQDWLKIE